MRGLGLRTGYIGAFGSDANGGLASDGPCCRVASISRMRSWPMRRIAERSFSSTRPGAGPCCGIAANDLIVPPDVLTPESVAARIVHVDDDDPQLAMAAVRAARAAGAMVTSDIEHAVDQVEELIRAR